MSLNIYCTPIVLTASQVSNFKHQDQAYRSSACTDFTADLSDLSDPSSDPDLNQYLNLIGIPNTPDEYGLFGKNPQGYTIQGNGASYYLRRPGYVWDYDLQTQLYGHSIVVSAYPPLGAVSFLLPCNPETLAIFADLGFNFSALLPDSQVSDSQYILVEFD